MSLPRASEESRVTRESRRASASDVVQFYRLVQGREPESESATAGFVGQDTHNLAAAFFQSPEFVDRVIRSAERGEDVWAGRQGPEKDLIEWAASTLPLSEAGVAALEGWADSWPGVYFALLSDTTLRAATDHVASDAALARLKAFAGLVAGVERIDASIVSGWVMARGPEAEPVALEVWAGGVFVGAGLADRFRRDIQDRMGGDGRVGFEIRPAGMARMGGAGPVRVDVRIAATGERIAEGEVFAAPPDTTGLSRLRAEIATVRATLDRLERALPEIASGLGVPLSNYGDYFEAWGRRPVVTHAGDRPIMVFLDAVGADAVALDRSVRALEPQLGQGDRLVLMVDRTLANMAADICNRTNRSRRGSTASIVSDEPDAGLRLRDALEATGGGEFVVLTDADTILSGDALALISEAFDQSEAVETIYVDEDRLDPEDEVEAHLRRHVDPILRPGFDRDLLLQLPYVGTTLGFRRAIFDRIAPDAGCEGLHGCDLVLRLSDRPEAVGHIARVIATRAIGRPLDADGEAWAGCVRRELARQATGEVEARSDILGVRVPGAIRVRHPITATRVSVIVPTRDRMDLLKPCIDSILRHRRDNGVELDLLIVDHESVEPETQAYLTSLVEAADARVVPFAGVFNWALMNNLAAAEATGQVLVFLNNDTVVLSPDWLEELARQAMRPEVGVVGARLLYADGTIQHAGFISRDANKDFLIHDGVGIAGSDGGYLGRHALVHASAVVTGACMAIRTALFLDMGGFDAANFPLEGNDADLCYRARAMGLSVLYDPYATLYHLESKTRGFAVSGEHRAASVAAQTLLRERWGERFAEDPGFNAHFDRWSRPFERLRPPPSAR